MKWGMLAISYILLLTGCNPTFSSVSGQQAGLVGDATELPQTFEIPSEFSEIPLDEETTNIPKLNKEPKPSSTEAFKPGSLLENARRTIELEARAIGTACNKYVMRVLEVSGFSKASFTANTFDLYAKKSLSHYKVIEFDRGAGVSEQDRLHRHLWSYPEKTPFILQWSRTGGYGHIAILERRGDNLVIYQASLRQYIARKDLTTVNTLLNGYNRRALSVYSELTP